MLPCVRTARIYLVAVVSSGAILDGATIRIRVQWDKRSDARIWSSHCRESVSGYSNAALVGFGGRRRFLMSSGVAVVMVMVIPSLDLSEETGYPEAENCQIKPPCALTPTAQIHMWVTVSDCQVSVK